MYIYILVEYILLSIKSHIHHISLAFAQNNKIHLLLRFAGNKRLLYLSAVVYSKN